MLSVRVLIISILCFVLFRAEPVSAQRPRAFDHIDSEYRKGEELFEKEKYGAAQEHFQKAIREYKGVDSELKTNAEYYSALCAIHLFNEDAESMMVQFIADHIESPKAKLAQFELAKFQYQKKNYRRAVQYFKKVDRLVLPEEQLAEYYFKSGYSWFMIKDMDQARLAFFEIKDINSTFTSPAIYYYAHIAYAEENYETALREFMRLTEDESFSAIVPFYIVQIMYLQKKYDEILEFAPPLLESATPQRALEIEKFIGEAYFEKEEYKEAIPHLEKYAENPQILTREDRYQLGFSYYKVQDYQKAAQRFERVTGKRDLLSQNAFYLLADCYLNSEQKDRARMAFSSASKMDFDEFIREDALFNFAKITYELSYSPFNEAIRTLNQYIELYPYSERIDEAYEFLVQAYLNTRNYKEALTSLDKIQEKDDRIKAAYQRVAFYRGLELFKNLKFTEAIDHLEKSLDYSAFDPSLKARAYYWKGEAYYRQKDFDMSLEDYNNFLLSPGAFQLREYKTVHYNIGYVYFKDKNYPEALGWFRKYENLASNLRSRTLGDAFNRIADCYFIVMDYQAAISYYQKAIDLKLSGTDYAMFQKGFTLGILDRDREKIQILTALITGFSNSGYLDDALFERGRSCVKIEEYQPAIEDYQNIINNFTNSSYVPKAMVQLGLVYYNMNRSEDAIEYFKRVIGNYPGSEEAQNAYTGLKNVYVSLNEVDTYFAYVRSQGEEISISLSEQDSLTYLAGENLYMSGECERAVDALNAYLENFEKGNFLLNAHFYRAECEMRLGNEQEAFHSYKFVLENPRNLFTEPALVAAGDINFRSERLNDAVENYILLEKIAELPENLLTARLGLMRCFYSLQSYRNTIESAQKLLVSDKISEELAREAYFKIGKSFLALDQLEQAQSNFERVASEVKSLEGAESKYRVAEICYLLEKDDDAGEQITEFMQLNTPHAYWLAKVFILDADLKIRKEDYFQAKHTLQAIVDYYEVPDDGILEEANRKLNEIKELEEFLEAPVEVDSMIIFDRDEQADTLNRAGIVINK